MRRVSLKFLFVILCLVLLVLGIVQQAGAQPVETNPEGEVSLAVQPGVWYGLVASLAGTIVFWASVVLMAKRRGY